MLIYVAFAPVATATKNAGRRISNFIFPARMESDRGYSGLKSQSNLRQIGQAILLYTNDSKGSYPDNFATLIVTEDITSAVFVSPYDDHSTPSTAATLNAIIADFNSGGHCSY